MKEELLDKIDLKLIALLEENGKLNNKELAAAVGLSVTPTFERVKRLERLEVITGYQAIINPKKVGKNLKVLCHVSLGKHQFEDIVEFEKAIKELKEVSAALHVTGAMDYMLTIEVLDMDAYQHFLKNRLARIPHIGQVNSSFVLSSLK
jgi:DNA-binding Lrp family transcriptional regulator